LAVLLSLKWLRLVFTKYLKRFVLMGLMRLGARTPTTARAQHLDTARETDLSPVVVTLWPLTRSSLLGNLDG